MHQHGHTTGRRQMRTVVIIFSGQRATMRGAPLSFRATSTIATPRARRAVSSVTAIQTCFRGEDAERKRSRQLQRGFKAAARSFEYESDVHSLYCLVARRLGCTHYGRCGGQRRGRTGLSHTLPLAVFPHPGGSLCWIAIRHTSNLDACTVYRAPALSFLSES